MGDKLMEIWENKKYTRKIGYGIGQYYEKTKEELAKIVKLDYLCDRKWEGNDEVEYDGNRIIRRADLAQCKEALIIVFTGSSWVYQSIQNDLNELGIDYIHVDEILKKETSLNGKVLRETFLNGIYEDHRNNKIYFDHTISDKLTISFQGSGNTLQIAKNVSIGNLYIRFGNNGFCSIGENTEIIRAEFYVADAKIQIGKDCLFANGIIVRTHDAHHIFDLDTHQRINVPKDVWVGDNVWVAYQVTLLGGTVIGTGSVVGTNAVTSSKFGSHQIIAGCPAKIIRENICWSRDDTEYFNHHFLEECISQEAIRYIE